MPTIARTAFAFMAPSLLLATLASCGDAPEQGQAATGSPLPSQAELDRLKGEGLKQAAREASRLELWLHYKIMQANGMEQALGGEQQAVAALAAISAGFERSATAAQAEVPRLIQASFDGNGFDAGVMGVGYGLFGGLISTGMLGSLSNEQVTELASKGPLKFDHTDGSAELGITQAGIDTALDQKIDEKGMTGRVKTKIHLDACPDANGKLTVTIQTESQMSAGGRSGLVKITYRRERWLDDDANLTNEAAEDFQNEMTGDAGAGGKLSVAERYTTGRDGQQTGGVTSQQGFDIFHIDDARHTEQLRTGTMQMLRLLADAMLLGFTGDPPYETGRCVDLQVRADPSKRTGARPNTAYTLFANPRSRLDGAPAGGTVTATLDGASTLNPTTKVKADARFDYANPSKKNETATVSFEARSRRGIGRATLAFDTKEIRGYRVVGGQNDFSVNQVVCSLTEPFDLKSNVGIVMHMSGGEGGGSYTVSGRAAGVAWGGNGRYTVALDGGGGKLNARGTATIDSPAGRFSDSVEPTFTLTPVEEGCGSG
jgi:hypothetical protein